MKKSLCVLSDATDTTRRKRVDKSTVESDRLSKTEK